MAPRVDRPGRSSFPARWELADPTRDRTARGRGQLGTFVGTTPAAEVQFTRTDRLSILAPDVADDTAAGLSITFAGRAGTI